MQLPDVLSWPLLNSAIAADWPPPASLRAASREAREMVAAASESFGVVALTTRRPSVVVSRQLLSAQENCRLTADEMEMDASSALSDARRRRSIVDGLVPRWKVPTRRSREPQGAGCSQKLPAAVVWATSQVAKRARGRVAVSVVVSTSKMRELARRPPHRPPAVEHARHAASGGHLLLLAVTWYRQHREYSLRAVRVPAARDCRLRGAGRASR